MNRRKVLVAIATGGTLGIAGCLGGGDDSSDDRNSTDSGEDPNGDGNGTADGTGNENGDGTGNGDPQSGGPEASFSADPSEPEVGQSVTLDAADSTGDIAEYRWDLTGDGETDDTGETVSYTFEESGTATVTLVVENAGGDTGETSRDVQVSPEPVAVFGWQPGGPVVNQSVSFDASDTVGNITAYRWDFTGDGETDETGETATYAFEEDGPSTVTLEVESATGTTDQTTVEVTVGTGPAAAFGWEPEEPTVTDEITFDASETAGNVILYRWNLIGDNEFDEAGTTPTLTYSFERGGTKIVTLDVEDESGQTDSVSRTLEVTDDRRVEFGAQFDVEPESPTVGEEVTLDGGPSQGDIVEYRWDLDGDGEFDRTTTDPVLTHTFDEAGEYTVTLEIEGEDGQTEETSTEVLVGGEDNSDIELELEINSTPELPDAGEEVTFEFTRVEGEFVEFRWDFTDNGNTDLTTTEADSVTRSFDEAGLNTVTVTGETASGATATASATVPIEPLPLGLLANWEPSEPTVGDEVIFTVGNTGDNVVKLRWDLTGDGSVDEVTAAEEGTSVSQTYDEAGVYTIVVEMETEGGRTVEFATEFVFD